MTPTNMDDVDLFTFEIVQKIRQVRTKLNDQPQRPIAKYNSEAMPRGTWNTVLGARVWDLPPILVRYNYYM